MTEMARLEAHLRLHPDDLESWLVYADKLSDQGDEHGTLVALECRLQQGEGSREERRGWRERANAIQRALESKRRPSAFRAADLSFVCHMGFVTAIKARNWRQTGLSLGRLVDHQPMPFLARLDLSMNELDDEDIASLARAKNLGGLASLTLSENRFGPSGLAALAACERLGALVTLDLSFNTIGPEGARALAASRHLRALVSLDLHAARIGDTGAIALAQSEGLSALRSLNLMFNEIGLAGASALVACGRLSRLQIGHNRLGPDEIGALEAVGLTIEV